MPDYEFFCRKCEQLFTSHMSIEQHGQNTPECPQCKSTEGVQRAISHFNVQTTKKSAAYR